MGIFVGVFVGIEVGVFVGIEVGGASSFLQWGPKSLCAQKKGAFDNNQQSNNEPFLKTINTSLVNTLAVYFDIYPFIPLKNRCCGALRLECLSSFFSHLFGPL